MSGMTDVVHGLHPEFWAIKGNESIKPTVQSETNFVTPSSKASFSPSYIHMAAHLKQFKNCDRVLMKYDVAEFHYDSSFSSTSA
jgi:hypothetical protein